MSQEFKNYTISGNQVILSLEKDIYNKDMVNRAIQSLSDTCEISMSDKTDNYEVVISSKRDNLSPEDLAVSFNDCLIGSTLLYH